MVGYGMPALTILIPVWNHWKTTAKCLVSIFKSDIPVSYKIIIIDDGSTDYTQKFLKMLIKEGRPIEVITNKENIGYVLSVNKAFKKCKSQYILILNNDIFLDKNCIKKLIEAYGTGFGLVGGAQHDSEWNEMHPLKYFRRGTDATIRDHIMLYNVAEEYKNKDCILRTDGVHFACALTSKKVLDKVGLLDEQFSPANYEQEDWCLRVKEAGFEVGICPSAKYIHYVAITAIDKAVEYEAALNVNRKKFHKKWGEKLRKQKI